MPTIQLTEATKKALRDLKIHPRQSYEELIKQYIEMVQDPEFEEIIVRHNTKEVEHGLENKDKARSNSN